MPGTPAQRRLARRPGDEVSAAGAEAQCRHRRDGYVASVARGRAAGIVLLEAIGYAPKLRRHIPGVRIRNVVDGALIAEFEQ
jgi:hypothetical protein